MIIKKNNNEKTYLQVTIFGILLVGQIGHAGHQGMMGIDTVLSRAKKKLFGMCAVFHISGCLDTVSKSQYYLCKVLLFKSFVLARILFILFIF